MQKMKSVSVLGYAKIAVVVGLVLGLFMGIFGYVGLSVGESVAGSVLNTMITFTKDDPKYDPNVNGMVATMFVGIARYAAEKGELEKVNPKLFKKLFPKEDIAKGDMNKSLDEIQALILPFIHDVMGSLKLLVLIGVPIGMGLFSFFVGLVAAFIYNMLGGVKVEVV